MLTDRIRYLSAGEVSPEDIISYPSALRSSPTTLAHDPGYVFGHSSFAGKTGMYVEEEQKVRRDK